MNQSLICRWEGKEMKRNAVENHSQLNYTGAQDE